MAWTTPTSRSTGYLVTAAVYDAEIIANLQYLHGDGGAVDLTAGGASYRVHGFGVDTTGAPVVGTAGGGGNPGVAINSFGDVFSIGSANRGWLNSSIVGDTVSRFQVTSTGAINWSTGALAADLIASRANIGQLFVNAKVLEALPAAQTLTVPVTAPIDLSTGMLQRLNVTAGGAATLTIGAPSHAPSTTQTTFLVVQINNTGGGTITLAWNAAYLSGNTLTLPANLATAKVTDVLFAWDGANWRIVSIG